MAFYKLWLWFSPWSKRYTYNYVYQYKQSLKTPEQIRKEELEDRRQAQTALRSLMAMQHWCERHMAPGMKEVINDFYRFK